MITLEHFFPTNLCLDLCFLVLFVQLLEDSLQVKQRGLVCDPLRLNLRFPCDGKDSNYFDDIMCEGKCFR